VRRGAHMRDCVALARVLGRLHLQAGLAARLGRPLPMGRVREVEVELAGLASLRIRTNDVPIFEVLGCEAYGVDLALAGPVRTVLDLGANVGFATVYLARRLPGARFCCVEPSARSLPLLRENLRRNVGAATAIRAAAVGEPGPRRVVEGAYGGLTRVLSASDRSGEDVPGMTVSELLDAAGFQRADFVKVDIQGGEADLFAHAEGWAQRVGALLAEIHPPLTVDAAAARLSAHGYERLPLPRGRLFDDMLYVRHTKHPASG
jgi:FkbM family methyltransferase